jgi:predicted nucleic acid-binding protein
LNLAWRHSGLTILVALLAGYAIIVAKRNKQGRPISIEDAQIAAIARTADLVLATRNNYDFAGVSGLKLVNPCVP